MPHKRSPSYVNLNKNTNWLSTPAVWAWYIGTVILSWLVVSALLDDAGLAWTYVHIGHGISHVLLPALLQGGVEEDQGKYDMLTFWEQVDSQVYGTRNRKLFTLMPVVLFVLATHGTDFRKQPLGLNLVVVLVLLIAKLPALHKVRIFGINKY